MEIYKKMFLKRMVLQFELRILLLYRSLPYALHFRDTVPKAHDCG